MKSFCKDSEEGTTVIITMKKRKSYDLTYEENKFGIQSNKRCGNFV